jgi:hypothetical protein
VLADGSSYDPTFGTNGLGEAPFGSLNGLPITVSLAPDGKIVVSGYYQNSGGRFAVARFRGDSSSPSSAIGVLAISSPATATAPDPILGALVLNDPAFLDSLTSGRHRRST